MKRTTKGLLGGIFLVLFLLYLSYLDAAFSSSGMSDITGLGLSCFIFNISYCRMWPWWYFLLVSGIGG